MSTLRSTSLVPPQMPWVSRIPTAYSRQSSTTGHLEQTSLARNSRLYFSSRLSPRPGG